MNDKIPCKNLVDKYKLQYWDNSWYTCAICYSILVDPHMCDQCQKFFCKHCIDKWTNSNKCINRCQASKIIPCRFSRTLLSNLIIECTKCRTIYQYSDWKKHNEVCAEYKEKTEKFWNVLTEVDKRNREKWDEIEKKSQENCVAWNEIWNDNQGLMNEWEGIHRESSSELEKLKDLWEKNEKEFKVNFDKLKNGDVMDG